MGFLKKLIKVNRWLTLTLIIILIKSVFLSGAGSVCPEIRQDKISVSCLNPQVRIENPAFNFSFNRKYGQLTRPLISGEIQRGLAEQESRIKEKRFLPRLAGFLFRLIYPLSMDKLILITTFIYILFVPVNGIVYGLNDFTDPAGGNEHAHYISRQLAGRFPGLERSIADRKFQEHTWDLLEDLSDAIAELMLTLNGHSSSNRPGSTAWALKSMNNNMLRSRAKRLKQKEVQENNKQEDPPDLKIDMERFKLILPRAEVMNTLDLQDARIISISI